MNARVVLSAMERAVDPPSAKEASVLEALDAHLGRSLPPGRGGELEARREFPADAVRAFAREGFVREIVPAQEGGCLDWGSAMRVGARLAAHDVDFALCLGGAVLGGMPVLVAGDGAQRAEYFGALMRGELGGFALSEWDHGSDLLAIDTRAEPLDAGGAPCHPKQASHFRLSGTKAPVNNGSCGANVVVLARTGVVGDPFGASLFLVGRGTPGVREHPRFETVGFRSMELSGIILEGAIVPRAMLLGNPGEGFSHARRSLEVTRSGVATMAAGAHASCLALALEHARSRVLYGQPIAALEGVQQIVGRVFARFAESLALARRAARAAARWPASARAWTAAAKLVCPTLLEESVHEVGTLLGARSLMETLPFARVRRTAPVFAIFDGSSQLQLDELWRYAARWRLDGAVAAEEVWKAGRALREPAHCPFDANKEDDSGALDRVSPPAILGALNDAASGAALGVLAEAAQVVGRVAQGARSSGQATRFRISSGAASLYALAALAEAASLAEGDARDALRAALAVRISELAPRLAATLVALERQGGPGTAELASRVLALARDADSLTAAGHAAALRFT